MNVLKRPATTRSSQRWATLRTGGHLVFMFYEHRECLLMRMFLELPAGPAQRRLRSSILFDTVAAMIALEEPPQPSATEIDSPYLTFKKMRLHVTNSAHTIDADKFQKDPAAYARPMIGAEFSEDDIAPCMTQIQTAASEWTEAHFVYVTTGFRNYPGYLAAVAAAMAGSAGASGLG